jgi:hypothetical protein
MILITSSIDHFTAAFGGKRKLVSDREPTRMDEQKQQQALGTLSHLRSSLSARTSPHGGLAEAANSLSDFLPS